MDDTLTMDTPEFYALAPRIALHDPLARLLGAAAGGRLDYGYGDAVKLAGHSCPTVAGAWLMLAKGLARLYPGARAERGGVRVALSARADEGVAGVIAAVASLVTGAAGEGGFKGLGGRFVRRGLLSFGADTDAELRLTRVDTGASVGLDYHPQVVPMNDALRQAMARALQPGASEAAVDAFGQAWQARVRALLVDHADDPRLVTFSD